jgi:dCTP deaminase
VRLYAGEGIAQVIFFESDEPCEVTYADKQGKYQAQQAITTARLG